jgi:hypothetical protein
MTSRILPDKIFFLRMRSCVVIRGVVEGGVVIHSLHSLRLALAAQRLVHLMRTPAAWWLILFPLPGFHTL